MASLELPLIDISAMDLEKPRTDEWHRVRDQVMRALRHYGSFEAVFDDVGLDLREALFGPIVEELFGLPLDTKLKNHSDKPNHGYMGQIPGFAFESLAIDDAPTFDGVRRFCSIMWPHRANPSFCNVVWEFARLVSKLEHIVRKMILESFGVGEYYDSEIDSTSYGLRLSEYGAVNGDGYQVRLDAHKDPNMISIVCQHKVDGLEIRSRHGDWIRVAPTPRSFTVLLGDAFEAWSNGRLPAAAHRVVMRSNETRYCAILGAHPKDGCMVRAPEDLVDPEHPLRFKPYYYEDYLRFRFSEPGLKAKHVLSAFCGILDESELSELNTVLLDHSM